MKSSRALFLALAAAVMALAVPSSGLAGGVVGTSLPAGFPAILDASLHTPLIGFGADGTATQTPVVFIHGNNDSPFPTACNPLGRIHDMAQYFADHGYSTSELWGVGYLGDECDLAADWTLASSAAHTNAQNIPDVARFVLAVLATTHAKRVDLVGHSLGGTIARAVARLLAPFGLIRRVVMIDAPNHGVIFCSPNPLNYAQLPEQGGFTPNSPFCRELGAEDTPFLRLLNAGDPTPGPTQYLVVRNADVSFVFIPADDGPAFPAFPAEDRNGRPHDFSRSASVKGAREISLAGQGVYDDLAGSAHLGILDSPETWQATFDFLSAR
jgi:pimeloyl-ACP methyl ester carboxylesterase